MLLGVAAVHTTGGAGPEQDVTGGGGRR